MLLVPVGALQLALAGEIGDGGLVALVCSGEEDKAGGLEPEVNEDSSQGERGKRLNHWLLFSISILESCSS